MAIQMLLTAPSTFFQTFYYDIECKRCLDRGDELCRSREIPMSSTVIQGVKGIYKKCKIWLKKNKFGDTPLIHASRLGLANMVWGVIQYAKQTNTNLDTNETGELRKFLGYKNRRGQTALDVAIEEEYFEVIKAFATALDVAIQKEYFEMVKAFATALDVAIEKEYFEVVKAFATALDVAIEKEYFEMVKAFATGLEGLSWQQLTDRNYDGKTLMSLLSNHEFDEIIFKAMKAAGKGKVDSSLTSTSISVDKDNHQECVKSLLREKIDLLYIHDKTGWAPFHYVVYHNIDYATVKALFEADPNIGSLDINDSKGRNILHVAVENKRMDTIKKLFGDKQFRTLANQRDSNGNTPLHLFMASDIEIDEMIMDRGVNIYAVNNENLTTLDVASSYEKRHILIEAVKTGVWSNRQTSSPSHVLISNGSKNESEIRGQIMSKFGDSLVVVTALIATATFAAAFTVPGGFDGNEGSKQGMPILLRKTAYKAFVVSNVVAFSCSCCVLFGYMMLQIYLAMYEANAMEAKGKEGKVEKIEDGMEEMIALQYMLTGIAMVAMASAFITGTYVILAPSLAFAISLCATCVCIIVRLSFLPTKYFRCFAKLLGGILDYFVISKF